MANQRPTAPRTQPLAAPDGAAGVSEVPPTDQVQAPVLPEGHVALAAPDGAAGVSWGGDQYEVADGILVVPEAAVEAMASFGFTPMPGEA